jgi:hypothetical protein
MSALANLKLVAAKRAVQLSPVIQRRNKVSIRITEQIALAQSKLDGKLYEPMTQRKVKNAETGEITTVNVAKRVKEWWFTTDSGKLCVQLRYGQKVVEIAKGKTAVELASEKELVATLEVLRQAVNAGEIDAQIEAVAGAVKAGIKK